MQQRPPVNRQGANPAQRPVQRPAGNAGRPAQQRPNPAPRPANGVPGAPRPPMVGRGHSSLLKMGLIAAAAVVALVAAFILQFKVFPDGHLLVYRTASEGGTPQTAEISGSSAFQFSEIMSSNGSALMDDKGEYSDWIELTNSGSSAMNLKGYVVAQKANASRQFTFPDMTLEPGEYVVVFCDNTQAENAGADFHAPFRLSAAGSTLMLFNPSGTAVEAVNVPSLSRNAVYCKDELGVWSTSESYTPGMANTESNHQTLVSNTAAVASDVVVTEFMASNTRYAPDEEGAYADWIEITNKGSSPVNLEGYGLSDTREKVVKWKFPAVTVGAGESLIVYCDSKDRKPVDGSPLHANFSLSSEKESVLFTNAAGQLIVCVDYDILKPDQSMSLQADGTWTTDLEPTPGY